MSKLTMLRQCTSCHGTGVFKRCYDKDGVATQCNACDGTGRELITGVPPTELLRREDIHTVIIAEVGNDEETHTITEPYPDWYKKQHKRVEKL